MGQGWGDAGTSGRFGKVFSNYMSHSQVYLLSRVSAPLPMVVMGVASLAGGLMIFLILPETQGTNLPETMEEAIKLGVVRQMKKENTEEPLFDSIT